MTTCILGIVTPKQTKPLQSGIKTDVLSEVWPQLNDSVASEWDLIPIFSCSHYFMDTE